MRFSGGKIMCGLKHRRYAYWTKKMKHELPLETTFFPVLKSYLENNFRASKNSYLIQVDKT